MIWLQKVCGKVEADEYEWIVDHSKVISRTSKKIAFKKHPISTVVNVMRFLNEKGVSYWNMSQEVSKDDSVGSA